ncbi:MAG: transglutaminase domain-containing protein [Candidatus Marinimicrobia bacterium]|nr:transglutaminase domain-containing protein [Candidatus Neomarinimicrobiota bacterium]MCF7921889.1 transglutaminase domain-containing protein [Candidatus Neomarinimicrobiota bacterium]
MRSRPNSEEKLLLQHAMTLVGDEYSNPRLVSGELMVSIENIEVLSGDSLIHSNLVGGIPADQTPSLHIWSSDIREYPTQKILTGSTIDPQPNHTFIDSEYGNRIMHWHPDLLEESRDVFTIRRTFRYITFDYRPQVDSEMERRQWDQIPLDILEKYTRPERFLEQDDALIDTVFSLLENIADPVSQAEVLYHWVQQSMTYVYPPQARGVRNAFETLAGDCGQYSALFMTMCRIAGIPARQQSGFNFVPGNTGAHVWSEIYLPVKGWVPVDATRQDGFLHLDNQRLITSVGLNIPLLNAPVWATFDNSEIENGKTDFMQMYTLAANGIKASYGSSRQVTRSVELP